MNSESVRRLSVLDISGQHAFWCDEHEARALLREGKCRLISRKGRARALQAVVELNRRGGLAGRGTAFDHTRYSHNHETEDNPQSCWTLTRLAQSTKTEIERVLAGCLR